jgi:hypothetical protein
LKQVRGTEIDGASDMEVSFAHDVGPRLDI